MGSSRGSDAQASRPAASLALATLLCCAGSRSTSAQDEVERVVSLPWERAMRAAGFPAWDDPWNLEELERGARALESLAGDRSAPLPRAGSLVSGALFQRFLDARSDPLVAQHGSITASLDTYLQRMQLGNLYTAESLLLTFRGFELSASFAARADFQADLRTGHPRAEPVVAGIRQMIDGLLDSLESSSSVDVESRVVEGFARLEPVLPALLEVLPVGERGARLDRLEALYRTSPEGPWRLVLGKVLRACGREPRASPSSAADQPPVAPITWFPASDEHEREYVRELTFADQSVDSLLRGAELHTGWLGAASELYLVGDLDAAEACLSRIRPAEREWGQLILGRILAARGDDDGARRVLESVALGESGETRFRLWAATALRSLGWTAPAKHRDELLGVVLEVPLNLGLDTLAAWTDGAVRYVNQGGSLILYDPPATAGQDVLAPFVRELTAAAARLVPSTAVGVRDHRPPTSLRVTLLTLDGPRILLSPPELDEQSPLGRTLAAGGRLLTATIDLVPD